MRIENSAAKYIYEQYRLKQFKELEFDLETVSLVDFALGDPNYQKELSTKMAKYSLMKALYEISG